MCGIAAVLFRGGYEGPAGRLLISMLKALQHRGRDSTGIAVYKRMSGATYKLRLLTKDVVGALSKITAALADLGADIRNIELNPVGNVSFDRLEVYYDGTASQLAEAIESTGVSRLISAGRTVEVIKHTVTVERFDVIFRASKVEGTHGVGHVRFSTESTVDLFHAHPFQSLTHEDLVVVHNGQITNYWKAREILEMRGDRFHSDNDSELIVHYVADKLGKGEGLEEILKDSIEELDGPFAYIVGTPGCIGIARDKLGLRPLLTARGEEVVVAASEEAAVEAAEEELGTPMKIRYLRPGEVEVWCTR